MNSPAELKSSPFENAGQPTAPGEILRNARVAAGIGQREIANDLYLTLCYVEALEKGEYDKLPGETFIRGYLRSYAQRLGMSEKRILSAYDASVHPEKVQERRQRVAGIQQLEEDEASGKGGALRWVVGLLAVAVIAVGGYHFLSGDSGRDAGEFSAGGGANPAPPAAEPATGPVATTPEGSATILAAADEPGATGGPDEAAPVAASGGQATAPAVDAESAAASPGRSPTSVAGANYLVVLFSEDCWIKVVGDGGKTLVSRLKRAGDVLEMTGRPPFSLRIGNASGVLVTYNGQPVDLRPHTENNVANVVLN